MWSAAVGFRPHSGWTALVAVAVDRGAPVVLLRERVQLVATFNYSFRQPYHTAARAGLEEGAAFIDQVEADASRLACDALRSVRDRLKKAGYRLMYAGLLQGSARPLPSLGKILAAHPLIHTADGELFRRSLAHAATRIKLRSLRVREKELLDLGAKTFRRRRNVLQRQLTELGRPLGALWSQDEKYAALVAWLALRSNRRSKST